MFRLRGNVEEEETETEKQMKIKLEKKRQLIETLEQEFELVVNKNKTLKEGEEAFLKKHEEELGVFKLPEHAEPENHGLKLLLDELEYENHLKEQDCPRMDTNMSSLRLENAPRKHEDRETLLKRQAELQERIEETRTRITEQEFEGERIVAKYKELWNDKLVLTADTHKIESNLGFVERLDSKQADVLNPKYKDVERALKKAQLGLAQEKVAKDLIVSALESKFAECKRQTIKEVSSCDPQASQIADFKMQVEDCQAEIRSLEVENILIDQSMSQLIQRIQDEEESLVRVDTLIYLSQYIDFKIKKVKYPLASKVTRQESIKQTTIDNIETLFEKDQPIPDRDDSAHRQESEGRNPFEPDKQAGSLDRVARRYFRSKTSSFYSMKRQKTKSLTGAQNAFEAAGVREKIDQLFGENPNGPEEVAQKIIESFREVTQDAMFHQSSVDCLLTRFKEQSEQLVELSKLLKEQKRVYLAYKSHRSAV